MTVLPQSPYSPELPPCDLFLNPEIKIGTYADTKNSHVFGIQFHNWNQFGICLANSENSDWHTSSSKRDRKENVIHHKATQTCSSGNWDSTWVTNKSMPRGRRPDDPTDRSYPRSCLAKAAEEVNNSVRPPPSPPSPHLESVQAARNTQGNEINRPIYHSRANASLCLFSW